MWAELGRYGDATTCYSAAVAAWLAARDPDWSRRLDTGVHLVLVEADDDLFGFAHFPAGLAASLGLAPRAADDAKSAAAAVLEDVARGGAIVAGDGLRLPWHVARGRRHVPHWFALAPAGAGVEVVDPFACVTDLGPQRPERRRVEPDELPALLASMPLDDPVLALRERFALGDDAPPPATPFRWLGPGDGAQLRAPDGLAGPDAVRRLADHFREHAQDLAAYRQADDVWSIARHRAFAARSAADAGRTDWAAEHGEPIARRWANVPPLLLQATLALEAGRAASSSVADALEDLAEREAAAA